MRWGYKSIEITPESPGMIFGKQIDARKLRQALNAEGEDGWELVSSVQVSQTTGSIVFVFKRPASGRNFEESQER